MKKILIVNGKKYWQDLLPDYQVVQKSIITLLLLSTIILGFSQERFPKDSTFSRFEEALKNPSKVVSLEIGQEDDFISFSKLDTFPNLRGISFQDIPNLSPKELIRYCSKQNQIEELEFFTCAFDSIEFQISKLKKLESLKIHETRGIDIESLIHELSKIENLNELDIFGSNLTKIPKSIKRLKNLKELSLGASRIKKIPTFLKHMPNLEVLDLFDNKISSIDVSPNDFQNLKWIDLCYNQFETFPIDLFSLPKLEKITIWYNDISSIPEFSVINTSLKAINLFHNNLSSLPNSIKNLQQMEKLYAGSNQLGPEAITKCYELGNLKVLSLRDNDFAVIPMGISNLSKLESVSFSYSKASELPRDLCKLQNLSQIGLGQMMNMDWKSCFECLSEIKTLRKMGIFSMGIEQMPEEIKLLQHIEVFWLGDNNFNNTEKERIKSLVPKAECEF